MPNKDYYNEHKDELKEKKIIYYRTYNGWLSKVYNRMKASCKERNMTLPHTKNEYNTWILMNHKETIFKLFEQWKNNNYQSSYRPSINRIDNNKTYTFDNIEIITWEENNKKGKDAITGKPRIYSTKSIVVVQLTLDDKFIAKYKSGRHASNTTGISKDNISKCCKGTRKTSGGFKWMYESEYNDRSKLCGVHLI